ncbi:MAG: M43 family zinc metalloprotease [Bacteroidota bacterium]|nr:M43 family zinc metalloprotease [Bacteroidota bacterium]
MNKYLIILSLSLLVTFQLNAQQLKGFCGTNDADQLIIKERMLENRRFFEKNALPRTGAKIWIPITYHLYARTDGTGRLPARYVFDNLCSINLYFADQEIEFFIKEIRLTNNTDIYDDPSSTLGSARIKSVMNQGKSSVNVFVASKARGSDPNVLAFYNGQDDYLVANKDYVNADGSILAHEIGHFLSLPHTFIGWETCQYKETDCPNPTPTLTCGGTLVEYVNRDKLHANGQKHCELAADGFCDTPADYNLGFGHGPQGDCTYNGCAKDPDGVPLNPDETIFMGYFIDCDDHFTQEQKDAMHRDYLSGSRAYLRIPVYNPKPLITESIIYIAPPKGSTHPGYDMVNLDWDPVANADNYLVEVATNIGFSLDLKWFFTKRTDTLITTLSPTKLYFWRVYAYNSNSFCKIPAFTNFRTPSFKVASTDLSLEGIQIYYQELQHKKIEMHITSDVSDKGSLVIYNLAGKKVAQRELVLKPGKETVEFSVPNPGLYFYNINFQSNKKSSGKIIVQ